MALHVPSFGAGVVLAGAPGQRRIDEVLAAESYDIGTRGALVAASDVTPYLTIVSTAIMTPGTPWVRLYALLSAMPGFDQTQILAIGEAPNPSLVPPPPDFTYFFAVFPRTGQASPLNVPSPLAGASTSDTAEEGIVVTGYPWPGNWTIPKSGGGTETVAVSFVCLGAREAFQPKVPFLGLYVVYQVISVSAFFILPISDFNALGTGANGDGLALAGGGLDVGTNAQQLYFRGIVAYNNHAFGWGFDSADVGRGDGPARVMFSNVGTPLKYGNDNLAAAGTDRLFTDSDAITLGGAGEIVRGALPIFGKLFFGTNKGLHFIAGYGRDSFLSDGFTPVMKAFNIVGPNAMIEGSDKLLYGVSDQGLWSFDGINLPTPLFQRLVDFDGQSRGYWDLIWTDETRTMFAYPGRTNQDLVWTAVDWDRHQILVGVPFCDATAGAGFGSDTVVIKYHVLTGGFTRQVFPGVQYTAVCYARREGQQRETRFMGTATAGQVTVQRYADTTGGVSPVMPTTLPVATFGPFAPFGPDGRGSIKRVYLTVAWEVAAALPLQFQVTTTVDQGASDDFLLTVAASAPGSPVVNDLWLDTSLTNTNIGNGSAGAITPAFPAALLNRWTGTAWSQLPGVGSNGQRAILRLPLEPRNGTWITMTVACMAAAGRFQLEGLGQKPGGGSETE